MFRSSSPLLRKSEPPVQVQATIITAWTIRHPTRNRNNPIARAKLYQLSYIPRAKWSMHEVGWSAECETLAEYRVREETLWGMQCDISNNKVSKKTAKKTIFGFESRYYRSRKISPLP
ncbi:hypothetical protein ACS0TY_019032 [Phlomoides rotata]